MGNVQSTQSANIHSDNIESDEVHPDEVRINVSNTINMADLITEEPIQIKKGSMSNLFGSEDIRIDIDELKRSTTPPMPPPMLRRANSVGPTPYVQEEQIKQDLQYKMQQMKPSKQNGYDKYHHTIVQNYDLNKELPIHNQIDVMDTTIILDETGSMRDMGTEPVESVKGYIKGQQESGFAVKIRIIRFAENILVMEKDVADPDINIDDYSPDGMTALIDAVIFGILYADKPQHFIIVTDGKDNMSVKNIKEMNDLIERAELCGWKFTFIGCTKEAYNQGTQFRMSSQPISLEREGAPPIPLLSAMQQLSNDTARLNRDYSTKRSDPKRSDTKRTHSDIESYDADI
jgi:hypothetical protein